MLTYLIFGHATTRADGGYQAEHRILTDGSIRYFFKNELLREYRTNNMLFLLQFASDVVTATKFKIRGQNRRLTVNWDQLFKTVVNSSKLSTCQAVLTDFLIADR